MKGGKSGWAGASLSCAGLYSGYQVLGMIDASGHETALLAVEAETLQHGCLGLTGNPGNRANIQVNTQQEHKEITLNSRGSLQSHDKAYSQVSL